MAREAIVGLGKLQSELNKIAAQLGPTADISGPLSAGGEEIQASIQHYIGAQTLIDTGKLHDSVVVVKIGKREVHVKTSLPYSAVHEFGGTFIITPKQRRFFWAKYGETGDTMWLALALSATYTIPPRPYFRPGVDTSANDAIKVIAEEITRILRGRK